MERGYIAFVGLVSASFDDCLLLIWSSKLYSGLVEAFWQDDQVFRGGDIPKS